MESKRLRQHPHVYSLYMVRISSKTMVMNVGIAVRADAAGTPNNTLRV